EGRAAAVLLRAGAVVDGVEFARKRRPTARTDARLADGPGKLMQVLGLDRAADDTPLFGGDGPAALTPPEAPAGPVSAGPRVGVTAAHDVPWRFWITGDPTVSAYRRHTPRRRPPSGTR
ncbi:MAG TPA: DNA-3-methyladenine glycosylase, partial [Actinoplanes sp.]|nr:DNA-3-methyladenine glycosylase [Actinoplanes sp.]